VGGGGRIHARNGALLSPHRLLRRHRAQAREKLRFVDGLLEDGSGLTGSECGVAGDHDDPDTSIVQLTDQGIGALAAAETEVDERNIGGCSQIRCSAAAAVATGPATSAPQAWSRLFTALPTCQQSSTTRIRTPFKSRAAASSGPGALDKVIGVASGFPPSLSAEV
jgi:hypothetical protein